MQPTSEIQMELNISAGNRNETLYIFAGHQLLLQFKMLFIPLYSLLFLVACMGNIFLVVCIIADKKLHNATNFFIGNLSIGDLLMCLTCVPLTVSYAFEIRGWLFGRFMCHFVSLMQATTVYVSVLSLTAIAVDRYIVVAYPIRKRITLRYCSLIVLAIWMVSLALAAPPSIYIGYLDLNIIGHDIIICEEFWKGKEKHRLVYSCMMLLMSYMIPLFAVTLSYCTITIHLHKRNVPGAPDQNLTKWNKRKRKVFVLLVISILAFAICWMPLQILNLICDLDSDFTIINKRYINVIQLLCHFTAMSSACYNPFIYASLHQKFRLHLKVYFRQKKKQNVLFSFKSFCINSCLNLISYSSRNRKDDVSLQENIL
ncbi:prolactin-releasing peptide receptor-like [Microcaecilia unicolor]|uniref:Prolactin-releasing peptide receptor-like n=1 Tax=Microcaecilia unicolor TaxID=1415580 RepID=A0A6P7ZGR6_9AMPH|nr:prolactin-releasing peptide receptor-like [Microcaecilia unicolor]